MTVNKKLRHFVTPSLIALAIVYFAFYTLFGNRGLYRMYELEDQLVVAQAQHEEVIQERITLEQNVTLLKPNSLDLDMVDQRTREVLGYAHPDDIVIELR